MNAPDYISASQAKKFCNYSPSSLVRWAEEGKIRIIRSPGGKRFYHIEDIKKIAGLENEDAIPRRDTICYARVSSKKQKEDLERQIEYLKSHCPGSKVVRDIGSGLNYHRRGLQCLLNKVVSGTIGKVVVTYKDRLCRYGIELIEWIFTQHNVELVVLCQEVETVETEEFATDIVDICNYFVSKYNGRKAAKYRAERARNKTHEDSSES